MTEWRYEDGPEKHPMWETQIELERGMMRAGEDKYRDNLTKAEERNQLTRVHAIRGVMTDWLPEVAMAIKAWVRDIDLQRTGGRPIAHKLVKALDPTISALITIRTILDGAHKDNRKLVQLAIEIGRTCEYEQQVRLWESKEPELYHHYREEHERNKATAVHRRRVNVAKFNQRLKDPDSQLQWESWTTEEHFRVGVALIDCLIRRTGWFKLAPDPEHENRKGSFKGPQLVLEPLPQFVEWLQKTTDMEAIHSPDFKPTVVPPRRWENTRSGGYWTPYLRGPRLVRFKAHQEHQKEFAADEYDALSFPDVYDALHVLQETSWRINQRVLDVALKAVAQDRGLGKLPISGLGELPPRTSRMLEHSEAWKRARELGIKERPVPDEETDKEILAWKRRASPIHRANAKRVSRYRGTKSTLGVAFEYRDFDRFYFPYMLDFRGRIYPVATYLQPQGNDLARGLLEFADGLPITAANDGARWLAIQLASMWGNDKWSYDERIEWVIEQEDMWRSIEADPMADTRWATCDKPWQALAAIFDWVGALDEGDGYVSHLPVMVDGTCNGIQHLAALTRDEVTGRYVNLIPADKPQDIYKLCAVGNSQVREEQLDADPDAFLDPYVEGLQDTLVRIFKAGGEEGEKAKFWLDLTGWNLPRSLTKRQVMVLPYGGSKDAFFKYTRQWLDENHPLVDPTEEQAKLRGKQIVFLSLHLYDVVSKVCGRAVKVMEWLQECASAVCSINQPIYWTTPSGFVVRHFYGMNRQVRCELMLDGEAVKITRQERTAKLSKKEQLQGIAPNYIHSLDAAALVLCLKRCREEGLEDVSAIHDAYGTHAANMGALAHFLREAFVEVHEQDVLGQFRAACQRVLVSALVAEKGMDPLEASEKADEMLPEPLEMGALDIRDVLHSEYFFA